MKRRIPIMFVLTWLICLSHFAHAQKAEATLNYSLIIYNPAKSLAGDRDLNGGGGSFGFNLGEHVTLKGEFEGYTTTTLTYQVTATAGGFPESGTFTSQGNMFTYLFGPQVNAYTRRARLFGEALFGGASTNAYGNFFKAARVTGLTASNNGFAMAIGGGLDIPFSKHMAVRAAQLDYFMTRYEWKALGINNQSNFRYQAGILFAF